MPLTSLLMLPMGFPICALGDFGRYPKVTHQLFALGNLLMSPIQQLTDTAVVAPTHGILINFLA